MKNNSKQKPMNNRNNRIDSEPSGMKPKIYSDEITSFITGAIATATSSGKGRISSRELAERADKNAIPIYSSEFKDRLYSEIVAASSSEDGPIMVYDLADRYPELGWDHDEEEWSFEEDHARAESVIREVIIEINQGGQRFIVEDSQGYLFPSAAAAFGASLPPIEHSTDVALPPQKKALNKQGLANAETKTNGKKRTHGDLLRAWLDMIHPSARAQFQKELLPKMNLNMARREISEEEYEFLLKQFRRELPHFLQYLLDYPC